MKKHEIKAAQPARSFSPNFGNYTTSPEDQAKLDALKAAEDAVRNRVNTDVAYQGKLLAIVGEFERMNPEDVAAFIGNEVFAQNFRYHAAHAAAQADRRCANPMQDIAALARTIARNVTMANPLTVPRF